MISLKQNKGITLIALVITIIVMLIIVSVTIRISVAGGLFQYSKTAALGTKESKAKEELEIVKMNWEMEKLVNQDATLLGYLESEKEKGNIDDFNLVEDGEFNIIKDGYETDIHGEKHITFYIYHTSDNTVETVETRDDRPFNIYSHVKDGLLYGGYYPDYYGKGSYLDDGVEVKDGTEIAYDGINSEWNYSDGYTENGKAMHPEAGVTYYLKEVPTYCLKQRLIYTYNGGDRILRSFYIFSAIDDLCYQDTGVVVDEITNKVKYKKVRKELTVNWKSGAQTYTTLNCFGVENGGYIALTILDDYLTEGRVMKTTPYWVTKDNVLVLGTADVRVYSLGNLTVDEYSYTRIDSFE